MYRALETADKGDRLSAAVDRGLIALIMLSVLAVVLESMSGLEQEFSAVFYWLEVFTVSVFSVEYLLRVWCSVEANPQRLSGAAAILARLRFMISFHALIDLLAILPFYLLLIGSFGSADMRFLRAVRLLRILKLTRYSSALDMLVTTIRENGRALAASFFVLLIVMLIAASGMHIFERQVQPVDFGSIPASMWWAFATLTTVGYGDVTPVTVGGKVFGALITVVGVGMVALPTGILASGYSQQLKLRERQYQDMADEALDDGILTDSEIKDLENLRVELGLGKHTASQILDTEKVRRAIHDQRDSATCPHCGGAL